MTVNTAERLEFAKSLAQEAAELAQRLRREQRGDFIQVKGLQDFVTFADQQVEKLIRARIADAYPEDAFLGEEDGFSDVKSDNIWVVDPIDGTTNFMRGLPEWGVSIAWCASGEIELGVIAAPDLSCLAWAQKGQGAFLNDQPMQVSDCFSVDQSILLLGRSGRTPLPDYLNMLERLIKGGSEYRRNGSAAISLLNVARGLGEAYYEAHLNAWDALAGLLLIQEAGGQYKADPLPDFLSNGSPVFADNGHLTQPLQRFTAP